MKIQSNMFRFAWIFLFLVVAFGLQAQQKVNPQDRYLMSEGDNLQILVHVWGEVNAPGQYRVADGTNVLELISLAGGPNEFSNLSYVVLTREYDPAEYDYSKSKLLKQRKENLIGSNKIIIKIDLSRYLNSLDYEPLLVLKPGDVVTVKKNSWFKFQSALRILTQFAIIGQAIYYLSNIE